MILLVTPHEEVRNSTQRFEEGIGDRLEVAESLRLAATKLRSSEYNLVVIDQLLVDAEPYEADTVLQHAGGAIPLQVNFAISDAGRVIREVKAAVARRHCSPACCAACPIVSATPCRSSIRVSTLPTGIR